MNNETTNEQRISQIKTVLAWGVAGLAAAVLVLVARPRRIKSPPTPPPALQITTNQDGTTELGISGPEVPTNWYPPLTEITNFNNVIRPNVNALGTNLTVELVVRTKETNVPGVICQVRTELATNRSGFAGVVGFANGTVTNDDDRAEWFDVHEVTVVTLPNGLVLSWTNPVIQRGWLVRSRLRTVLEPYQTNYWRSNELHQPHSGFWIHP